VAKRGRRGGRGAGAQREDRVVGRRVAEPLADPARIPVAVATTAARTAARQAVRRLAHVEPPPEDFIGLITATSYPEGLVQEVGRALLFGFTTRCDGKLVM
jgi:hypothetical protein